MSGIEYRTWRIELKINIVHDIQFIFKSRNSQLGISEIEIISRKSIDIRAVILNRHTLCLSFIKWSLLIVIEYKFGPN